MIWGVLGVVLVIGSLYFFLIISYFIGFRKNINSNVISPSVSNRSSFSIVIAARNEEDNIGNLLQDLLNQDYPSDLFEVIIVDDESEDNTIKITKKLLSKAHFSYQVLESKGGKKAALALAMKHLQNEIVVLTDADCSVPIHWLDSYCSAFQQQPILLLAGPVIFNTTTLLSQLFCLEFATLVASGAGAIGIGKPVMVNGANLAVRRETIEKVSRKAYDNQEVSGDDVFLMSEIRKMFGKEAVGFLNSMDNLVKTSPPKNIKAFINQRLRWTSKSKSYADGNIIFSALVVFIYNLTMVLALLMGLVFGQEYYLIYLSLLVLKLIVDAPLSISFLKKYKLLNLMIWFFPLQIAYPFYIVIIGILGQFLPYSWKGKSTI